MTRTGQTNRRDRLSGPINKTPSRLHCSRSPGRQGETPNHKADAAGMQIGRQIHTMGQLGVTVGRNYLFYSGASLRKFDVTRLPDNGNGHGSDKFIHIEMNE